MGRNNRFWVLAMASLLIFSVCACSRSVKESDGNTVITDVPTESQAEFSDNVYGSLLKLMQDVMGHDVGYAEEKFGEFFGMEIKRNGVIVSQKVNGSSVATVEYFDEMAKDELLFDSLRIVFDEKDGYVRKIEFSCGKGVHFNDSEEAEVAEFRKLCLTIDAGLNTELQNVCGEPYSIDNRTDGDAVIKNYKLSDNEYVKVVFYDPSESSNFRYLVEDVAICDSEYLLKNIV